MATVIAIVFTSQRRPLPVALRRWLQGLALPIVETSNGSELIALTTRGRPRVVVFDARAGESESLRVLAELKGDPYTAIIPSIVVIDTGDAELERAFAAGADEVVHERSSDAEIVVRARTALTRSDRDLYVHPSTRLPGTVEIEAEIDRRLVAETLFATCYADLDHFKEFNDRYSYYDGDRVITMLARILRDVVKGISGDAGFVGHIGGDDFIFIIPTVDIHAVCSEIVSIFDLLIPLQYSEPDRRAGYFFGKDRRGQLHRVPLMTVSIGVVTNERRRFAHAAQVSALATEMKSYAKTLPGSVFSIDRRQDSLLSESRTSGPSRIESMSSTEEQ